MTLTARALLATVRASPGDKIAYMVYADALQDAGDEEGAHLQRAIAEPHNDGHRLALADALERTAGEVACPQAGYAEGERHHLCARCQGRCRVSDGRREFAEFIRAQCELAARDDERCGCRECRPSGQHNNGPCRSPLKPLRARERELWPAVRGRFSVDGCHCVLPTSAFVTGESVTDIPIVTVRRGFPAIVRCTLAEWMGGERCQRCYGSGEFEKHEHSYRCGRCHGSGRTHGIGPRLAQAWPVERVEVTDAVIHQSGGNDTYYVGGLGRFPKEFWRGLEGHRTIASARAALSAACIQWARSQVI